ncbi:MAG TPA: alpha/beta fold hydrolase [Sphingomicrobium sp.]|nr:alpha/beta fold hydrolase [Sphingomicrobium sp.]
MTWSQTDIIFPAHAVSTAGPMPKGSERLAVDTPDGETLVGIYLPAAQADSERTLVLGFGGNAWNGQDVAEYLHELYPQADVAAFHYRGYRPSTGRPSADSLITDAPLVFDAAVKRVKPKKVIAAGFSIGSGIAATLAGKRKLTGLILVTPFDSLKAVAQSAFPWLPIGPFFQHEIDAAAALSGVKTPVAILAAERDELIPPARTRALRPSIAKLVYDRTIEHAGHNDIYQRHTFQEAMREALLTVGG